MSTRFIISVKGSQKNVLNFIRFQSGQLPATTTSKDHSLQCTLEFYTTGTNRYSITAHYLKILSELDVFPVLSKTPSGKMDNYLSSEKIALEIAIKECESAQV